jgi:DNA helicase MCM8
MMDFFRRFDGTGDFGTRFTSALTRNPDATVSCIAMSMHMVLTRLLRHDPERLSRIHGKKLSARLCNYRPVLPLRSIKADTIGTFVAVRGTVVRVTNIKPVISAMRFSCVKCGKSMDIRLPDGKYRVPERCLATSGCRSRTFLPDPDGSTYADWQRIRLQEIIEGHNDSGRVPRTFEVELMNDEVDTCVPGDIVNVTGIVKTIAVDADRPGARFGNKNQKKAVYYSYIAANAVQNSKQSDSGKLDMLQFTLKDLYGIQRIVSQRQLFPLLCQSLCPSIFGNEMVKAGLLLSLVGGKQKFEDQRHKMNVRGDIHVLIVGDPGLGKSQLLQGVTNVAPRGVYVCGSYASAAGLTVTIHKDPASHDYMLEAGALVLSDQGVCCIDEFDKMSKDWQSLLEAMEQQSISVAKAGIVANLPSRASLVAAANPAGGHYNRSKTVAENIKMTAPLLSRFDLIYVLLDKPDTAHDERLSRHVMMIHDNKSPYDHKAKAPTASQSGIQISEEHSAWMDTLNVIDRIKNIPSDVDIIPAKLLRKYIGYARRYVEPQMTKEACDTLKNYYLTMRASYVGEDGTPVTTRQLESLIRLAEARAKAELRDKVTERDARDVIQIMEASLKDALDDHGGFGGLPILDFRNTGNVSRRKQGEMFMVALRGQTIRRNEGNRWQQRDLFKMAEKMNLDCKNYFHAFLDGLNDVGEILRKGATEWEVTGV